MPKLLQIETLTGEPLALHNQRITLRSQKISTGWQFRHTQLAGIFQRPTAVLIDNGEAPYTIPIIDVTRIAQIGIWGLFALLAGIFFWYQSQQ